MSIYDLIPGQLYEVVEAFTDFDHGVHPVGERWVFDTTNYLPYDSGLTLHVRRHGVKQVYRLQLQPQEQEALAREFGRYVAAVPAGA